MIGLWGGRRHLAKGAPEGSFGLKMNNSKNNKNINNSKQV